MSQEDHLEKQMATHSSIPAWRIPWTEEPGLQPLLVSHTLHTLFFHVSNDTTSTTLCHSFMPGKVFSETHLKHYIPDKHSSYPPMRN